ncbi:MAG: DNA-directed RNA polymerase subunit alpha [Armatimonadetes bacterium]|nr:DNA-directed RNA polymerase subunit alpha [Armatimonadota bacterium]
MITNIDRPMVTCLASEPTYGKFEVLPLERGYGATLGNAMRRVLLSSIPGASVTAIKIEGILHEFAPIPGVKEDVVRLLMNLKNLSLVVHRRDASDDEPRVLKLDVKGAGRVTAADLRAPADVEICNPELYLCTMSDKKARLSLEVYVEVGRGYVTSDQMDTFRGRIGVIQVSALFSPVRRVNYFVESTRVGERTDYDRLVLEVWTNGAVKPADAISQAARQLQQQVAIFTGFEDYSAEAAVMVEPPAEAPESLVPDIKIDEMNFTQRPYNRLKSANINTLRDLVLWSPSELMNIRNFGEAALKEVREKVEAMGFNLKNDNSTSEDDEL